LYKLHTGILPQGATCAKILQEVFQSGAAPVLASLLQLHSDQSDDFCFKNNTLIEPNFKLSFQASLCLPVPGTADRRSLAVVGEQVEPLREIYSFISRGASIF
jgi:hypothetical protein